MCPVEESHKKLESTQRVQTAKADQRGFTGEFWSLIHGMVQSCNDPDL